MKTSTAKIETTRHGDVTTITVCGHLDHAAWQQVADAADAAQGVVVIEFTCDGATWPCREANDACTALLRLRKRGLTFTYIDEALGASYLLAACCGCVKASPVATIGRFALGGDAATGLFGAVCEDARPYLSPGWLDECEHCVVSGEAAASKQLRLVDGLANGLEEVLAGLFTKNDAGKFVPAVLEANEKLVLYR